MYYNLSLFNSVVVKATEGVKPEIQSDESKVYRFGGLNLLMILCNAVFLTRTSITTNEVTIEQFENTLFSVISGLIPSSLFRYLARLGVLYIY